MECLGEVELNGRRIRIETVNISGAIESLVQVTSENGIRIEEVNTIRPTLENAFVKLTGVTPETMKIEKERGRR
jgi:ABC-2 type transport system ATP-binding protein